MSLTTKQIIAIERRTRGLAAMLDPHDRNTIANALLVASAQYREDARSCKGTTLEDQFERQAAECDVLRERLEP